MLTLYFFRPHFAVIFVFPAFNPFITIMFFLLPDFFFILAIFLLPTLHLTFTLGFLIFTVTVFQTKISILLNLVFFKFLALICVIPAQFTLIINANANIILSICLCRFVLLFITIPHFSFRNYLILYFLLSCHIVCKLLRCPTGYTTMAQLPFICFRHYFLIR